MECVWRLLARGDCSIAFWGELLCLIAELCRDSGEKNEIHYYLLSILAGFIYQQSQSWFGKTNPTFLSLQESPRSCCCSRSLLARASREIHRHLSSTLCPTGACSGKTTCWELRVHWNCWKGLTAAACPESASTAGQDEIQPSLATGEFHEDLHRERKIISTVTFQL